MRFIVTILFSVFVLNANSAAVYFAQNQIGAGTGADTNNCQSVATWNSGNSTGSSNCLFGVITNGLTLNGTNEYLLFLPNSKLSAPTWSGAVINASGSAFSTIDGGQNGIIEATANGTGLAFSNNIPGVYVNNCSNLLVKNLLIQNLYVYIGPNDQQPQVHGGGTGISINGTWKNITISNCVAHDMFLGFGWVYGADCAFGTLTYSTAYNCNWGGNAGDSGSTATLNQFTVDHCHFYNWQNWEDSADSYHHNGFYLWAEYNGAGTNAYFIANHVGPGFGNHNTSGLFVSGNQMQNVNYWCNLFDASDGTSPANALLNIGTYSPQGTNTVYNNTFVGANATALIIAGHVGGGSDCKNIVLNNEFYNCRIAFQIYSGGTVWNILTTDTNNFSIQQGFGASADGNGGSPQSLAYWQAFNNQYSIYLDPHSTTSNALLDGSFRPQAGSPLIGSGINLTAQVPTDYLGNVWTLPMGIGAIQYQAPVTAPSGGGAGPAGMFGYINKR